MAQVVDLRGGRPGPPPAAVLADPTGRRARLLARAGRVVGVVFLLWLAGLALAGLGILPAGYLPLAHSVGQAPAPLAAAQRDSSAATARTTAGAARSAAARSQEALHRQPGVGRTTVSQTRVLSPRTGRRTAGPKHGHGTPRTPASAAAGTSAPSGAPSAAAAPRSRSTPGQSRKTATPGYGRSSASPGHATATTTTTSTITTTTTTPTRAGFGSAPGQVATHGRGNAGHG